MVSLSDIASQSGYSVSVVSRALNPHPDKHSNIARQTREKIQTIADKAGYRPNHAASFAKRGMNATVGVFLPRSNSDLITRLIEGIAQVLSDENFPMRLHFGVSVDAYLQFMNDMISLSHSGIITYPTFDVHDRERYQETLETFLKNGGRCVCVNTSVEHISGQIPQGVPMVTIDNVEGGRMAAEHLIDCGCRSFLNLTYLKSDCFEQRTEGFMQALALTDHAVHTLPLPEGRPATELSIDALRAEILRIIEKAPKHLPLGIFAGADTVAMQVLRAISGTDLRVPADVKIVGFDDSCIATISNPPLTTICQPFEEEGRLVACKLINMIYRHRDESSEVLQPRLVVRQST